MEPISIQEFARLEMRVARVLSVELHPDADRLYVVRVDGGEERQIVAGIRGFYTPEELVGRQIVVVWNLEPATIRGVTSQGMLLAVQESADDGQLSIITTDRPITPGSRVR